MSFRIYRFEVGPPTDVLYFDIRCIIDDRLYAFYKTRSDIHINVECRPTDLGGDDGYMPDF